MFQLLKKVTFLAIWIYKDNMQFYKDSFQICSFDVLSL